MGDKSAQGNGDVARLSIMQLLLPYAKFCKLKVQRILNPHDWTIPIIQKIVYCVVVIWGSDLSLMKLTLQIRAETKRQQAGKYKKKVMSKEHRKAHALKNPLPVSELADVFAE